MYFVTAGERGQIHAQIWVTEEGAGELGSRNFSYSTERKLSSLSLSIFLFLEKLCLRHL